MRERAKLSVIIPAYNADAYIDDCLKSVMTQENASFQVVLVNDGSTDKTAEICKRWLAGHDNLIYLEQENQGQGTARNVAVNHACGEWLVFLDADDKLRPGALECLEKSMKKEYDMIGYGGIFFSRDQRTFSVHFPPYSEEKIEIMGQALSVLWDKMFRRELWKKEEIQMSNAYGEDIYPVYMMMAKARKIHTLQRPLVCHYDRADNLSSTPGKILEILQSLSEVYDRFLNNNLFEPYKEPLFLLAERQHSHYKKLWEQNRLPEEKRVSEELELLIVKYFSREYQKIFHIEREQVIIIGRTRRPFPDILEHWDILCYDCLEQYILDENKPQNQVCHLIVDVENEAKPAFRRQKPFQLALSYWERQCEEVLEIKEKGGLDGIMMLYCPSKYSNDIVDSFERSAEQIWNCGYLRELADFWKHVYGWRDGASARKREISERDMKNPVMGEFNYRWGYYRSEQNVDLLCAWLNLRQSGRTMEAFFSEHGFQTVGIYGVGYLGRLLINELNDINVTIQFLVDRNRDLEMEYDLYSPEEKLPEADVLIITVINQYEYIRRQIDYEFWTISLQEVIDWCMARE